MDQTPLTRTDTTCMICSADNPDWYTTDNMWAFGLDYKDDHRRVFCPLCFINTCQQIHGLQATWRLVPQLTCAECRYLFDLVEPDDELCPTCYTLDTGHQ